MGSNMEDTSTLRGRVEYVLARNEQARDSDIQLTVAVWRTFYYHKIKDDWVHLTDVLQLPREDQISRIRRKLQEEGHFRGTNYVERRRKEAAEDAREHSAPYYARCP